LHAVRHSSRCTFVRRVERCMVCEPSTRRLASCMPVPTSPGRCGCLSQRTRRRA
jgi:hypothetical protein